jgi:hypothetical protein
MNTEPQWQFVGSVPENYERYLVPSIFAPWADDLVEIAALEPGQRLLDIACGTGEAQVEHDGAKTLMIEIRAGSPADQFFDAKVKVLSEEIQHHVREEEKPDGILARAKEAGAATPDLAK